MSKPLISTEEYENIIWDDLTNKRKQERDLDFNTIASHLANKVIEAYNITPNKNNQDISDNYKLNIEYVVVNPTAGSHCGPDTVGIAFYAKSKSL